MNYSNRTNKVKTSITTLNLQNRINNNNNKISVTKTFLYCHTCGKSIQKNSILCYIFIDCFCSKKCHDQKHKINSEKIVNVD
jgi:hypothetical protein